MSRADPDSEASDLSHPVDWRVAGIGPGSSVPPALRVTRDNWRMYPWSRWAFQHTRELVPSRALPGSTSPRMLHESVLELDQLTIPDTDGSRLSWREFEEQTFADGLIVLHDGKIIYERYLNGMTPKSVHHAFSVTKSFIGLLAEILIAEGALDPDAPVSILVPELAKSAFGTASVRNLLDMTDGVAFDENYENPDAEIHRYSASYWSPQQANGGAREAAARLTRRSGPPGSSFSYRTPVADVLGWCLHSATGTNLTDLFAQRIWQPAGCEDEGHFLLDIAGDEIAASGLNTSLRDMARLALFLMDSTTLPIAARASLLAGADRRHFAQSPHAARSSGSYRSQWWVSHDDHQGIAALGVYGQRVHIDMASGLALIRFGSHPVASNLVTDSLHRAAMDTLRRFLL